VTAKVNDRGSVTRVGSDPTSPAAAFARYFDALTAQLSRSFLVGNSPWLPFRLVPNDVQLAIHSVPLTLLSRDPEELFPSLADSMLNSKNVQILLARFLNPIPKDRAGKSANSVIGLVKPRNVPTMQAPIRVFSLSRTIERAYSSNHYTQCRNCWGFRHVAPNCPSADPVCPLCSLNHFRSNQLCPNPTCPSSGNLKATPSCCSSSPSCRVNGGGEHTAPFRDCPSRPAPPTLTRFASPPKNLRPLPAGDEIDTATDDDNPSIPLPSSVHSNQLSRQRRHAPEGPQ